MKKANTVRCLILGTLAALIISGCSYPISAHLRDEARDINIPMVANNPDQYKGDIVIWGGKIIKTRTLKTGTQVYVLHMPLDYMEKPEDNLTSRGRFIAATQEFLDPELYSSGKLVTVAGTVTGTESHPVGETEYPYPVIDIKEIHLFKPETQFIYTGGWYGWGPAWYGGPFLYDYPDEHFYFRRDRDFDRDEGHESGSGHRDRD